MKTFYQGRGTRTFLRGHGRLFQTPRSSFWRPHNTLLFAPASVPARSRRWGGPVPLLARLVCNRSSSDLTAESCAACGSRPAATWACPSRAPHICPLSAPPPPFWRPKALQPVLSPRDVPFSRPSPCSRGVCFQLLIKVARAVCWVECWPPSLRGGPSLECN